ncbi:MAG TPA: spore coat protein, partial [Candidatus Tenderia electrophaga]|nr:spore coat protein [Candidatus Tenderia electrophaga]
LPDIGIFFNQDVALALTMVKAVKAAGARYLKGEILHDAEICLKTDLTEQYLGDDAQPVRENYRQLIERKTLPLSHYEKIFAPCQTLGMGLVLSVYDQGGADFGKQIGACALKIASTNVVHAPLIRYCAGLDLPLIIDTGKASLDETIRAMQWARDAGAKRLILEYSPPAPPAPVSQHNLRVFDQLANMFDGPIGLSDHHAEEEMLYAATALGYRVLEKGLCADNSRGDQDVFHALPIAMLADVIRKCRNIHAALGDASAAYIPPATRPAARMGIVARRDLACGDVIDIKTVRFAFPTLGIAVEEWDKINQLRLTTAVAAGQPIEWCHVTPATA